MLGAGGDASLQGGVWRAEQAWLLEWLSCPGHGGGRQVCSLRQEAAVASPVCRRGRAGSPGSLLLCSCRLSVRPGAGGVRARVGLQQSLLSQPTRTATFQQRFDARQKIGLADARLKLGVKDAREKLLQKDARFRIRGKVQDAREMLNSRKQQSGAAPPKPRPVADAREKISLKRSAPASFMSPPVGAVTPALKLTKTIQVGRTSGHTRI